MSTAGQDAPRAMSDAESLDDAGETYSQGVIERIYDGFDDMNGSLEPVPSSYSRMAKRRLTHVSPPVSPGQIVYYYPNGTLSDKPVVSIVLAVSREVIYLRDMERLMAHDCVRHISDPKLSSEEIRRDGAWDFIPGKLSD